LHDIFQPYVPIYDTDIGQLCEYIYTGLFQPCTLISRADLLQNFHGNFQPYSSLYDAVFPHHVEKIWDGKNSKNFQPQTPPILDEFMCEKSVKDSILEAGHFMGQPWDEHRFSSHLFPHTLVKLCMTF